MIFNEGAARRKAILETAQKSLDGALELLERDDLITPAEWETVWRLRDEFVALVLAGPPETEEEVEEHA